MKLRFLGQIYPILSRTLSLSRVPGNPRWKSGVPAWSEQWKTLLKWLRSVWGWTVLLSPKLGDTGENHLSFVLLPTHTSFSPHLLAPTASDLQTYGAKDTVLAGFHTDLNFLTIHGRSRYPGLNIWARNTGKRIPVVFPIKGKYLLVQVSRFIKIDGRLMKCGSYFLEAYLHLNICLLLPLRLESSWSTWLVGWSKQDITRLS